MDGLPRIVMLGLPLKKSEEIPDLDPMRRDIALQYELSAVLYRKEFEEFTEARRAACYPSIDYTGLSKLKRYYAQLQLAKGRFRFSSQDGTAVIWKWSDALTNNRFESNNLNYEEAAVLYNIGALHSLLGVKEKRADADAQAQECIVEKSLLDERPANITAKLTQYLHQAYDQAATQLAAPSIIAAVPTKFQREWRRRCQLKASYYETMAAYYTAFNEETTKKFGKAIAWYQVAEKRVKEGEKLAKEGKDSEPGFPVSAGVSVQTNMHSIQSIIQTKLAAAIKENDFIYHEAIPLLETLELIKAAGLVKGVPFDHNDPEVRGPDIFQRLVPMKTLEASSIYSEQKASLLRAVTGEVEEKDAALQEFLSGLDLDPMAMLAPDPPIQQELYDGCARIGGLERRPEQELSERMQALATHSMDADAEVQSLQTRFESIKVRLDSLLTVKPNEDLRAQSGRLRGLRDRWDGMRESLKQAGRSNSQLRDILGQHLPALKRLNKPVDDIIAELPSVKAIVEDTEASKILEETKRIFSKIDEMCRQRVDLVDRLRQAIHSDDITVDLLTADMDEATVNSLFKTRLQKHDALVNILRQNLAAQENIEAALVDLNANFSPRAAELRGLRKRRTEELTWLVSSGQALEDLLNKCGQGVSFYEQIASRVKEIGSDLTEIDEKVTEQEFKITQPNMASLPTGASTPYYHPNQASVGGPAATTVNNGTTTTTATPPGHIATLGEYMAMRNRPRQPNGGEGAMSYQPVRPMGQWPGNTTQAPGNRLPMHPPAGQAAYYDPSRPAAPNSTHPGAVGGPRPGPPTSGPTFYASQPTVSSTATGGSGAPTMPPTQYYSSGPYQEPPRPPNVPSSHPSTIAGPQRPPAGYPTAMQPGMLHHPSVYAPNPSNAMTTAVTTSANYPVYTFPAPNATQYQPPTQGYGPQTGQPAHLTTAPTSTSYQARPSQYQYSVAPSTQHLPPGSTYFGPRPMEPYRGGFVAPPNRPLTGSTTTCASTAYPGVSQYPMFRPPHAYTPTTFSNQMGGMTYQPQPPPGAPGQQYQSMAPRQAGPGNPPPSGAREYPPPGAPGQQYQSMAPRQMGPEYPQPGAPGQQYQSMAPRQMGPENPQPGAPGQQYQSMAPRQMGPEYPQSGAPGQQFQSMAPRQTGPEYQQPGAPGQQYQSMAPRQMGPEYPQSGAPGQQFQSMAPRQTGPEYPQPGAPGQQFQSMAPRQTGPEYLPPSGGMQQHQGLVSSNGRPIGQVEAGAPVTVRTGSANNHAHSGQLDLKPLQPHVLTKADLEAQRREERLRATYGSQSSMTSDPSDALPPETGDKSNATRPPTHTTTESNLITSPDELEANQQQPPRPLLTSASLEPEPLSDPLVLNRFIAATENLLTWITHMNQPALTAVIAPKTAPKPPPSRLDDAWTRVQTIATDLNHSLYKGRKPTQATALCCPAKNRNQTHVPYDANRVVLVGTKDDYYNASHIDFLDSLGDWCPRYLIAQAPLPRTVADFWRMILSEACEMVVLLLPTARPNSPLGALTASSDPQNGEGHWGDACDPSHIPAHLPSSKIGTRFTVPGDGSIELRLQAYKEGGRTEGGRGASKNGCTDPTASYWIERILTVHNHATQQTRSLVHLCFHHSPALSSGANLDSSSELEIERLSTFVQHVHNCYKQQRNLVRPIAVVCPYGAGLSGIFVTASVGLFHAVRLGRLPDWQDVAGRLCQQRRGILMQPSQLATAVRVIAHAAVEMLARRDVVVGPRRQTATPSSPAAAAVVSSTSGAISGNTLRTTNPMDALLTSDNTLQFSELKAFVDKWTTENHVEAGVEQTETAHGKNGHQPIISAPSPTHPSSDPPTSAPTPDLINSNPPVLQSIDHLIELSSLAEPSQPRSKRFMQRAFHSSNEPQQMTDDGGLFAQLDPIAHGQPPSMDVGNIDQLL